MLFFDRAFRSFFLGGAIYAVISMMVWWAIYPNVGATLSSVNIITWHAHEMVFGYALATVAGFLITAVLNWSKMETASGWKLAVIFLLWAAARIGYLADIPLIWVALFDLSFNLGLFLHFAWPVYRKKLTAQIGLASKFLLLLIVNVMFYTLLLQDSPNSDTWLILNPNSMVLLGLFLILAINLTMIRRVLPFFTEKSLGLPAFKEFKWVNRGSMIGFFMVMMLVIIPAPSWLNSLFAWTTALLFSIRLVYWYHPKIWQSVLLWPLHLSYAFMTLGMIIYGFWGLGWVSQSLAIHALSAGGIGLLCSAIMARISLGHTKRNIFNPPKTLAWVFIILTLGAITRVLTPLIMPSEMILWMQISQILWGLGFAWLVVLYWKILTQPEQQDNSGINL